MSSLVSEYQKNKYKINKLKEKLNNCEKELFWSKESFELKESILAFVIGSLSFFVLLSMFVNDFNIESYMKEVPMTLLLGAIIFLFSILIYSLNTSSPEDDVERYKIEDKAYNEKVFKNGFKKMLFIFAIMNWVGAVFSFFFILSILKKAFKLNNNKELTSSKKVEIKKEINKLESKLKKIISEISESRESISFLIENKTKENEELIKDVESEIMKNRDESILRIKYEELSTRELLND
jgi:peptidoglycan hydrolase CwlO-like protein